MQLISLRLTKPLGPLLIVTFDKQSSPVPYMETVCELSTNHPNSTVAYPLVNQLWFGCIWRRIPLVCQESNVASAWWWCCCAVTIKALYFDGDLLQTIRRYLRLATSIAVTWDVLYSSARPYMASGLASSNLRLNVRHQSPVVATSCH